jgi:hypothetical protein
MSYADCLARISQIDSLISGRNSGWAAALASSSGTSLADQSLASGSTFSSVLEGLVGTCGCRHGYRHGRPCLRRVIRAGDSVRP